MTKENINEMLKIEREKRYLEIKDKAIERMIYATNDWYAFCSTIYYELGIENYSLWIGTLIWGSNEERNIVAHMKNKKIFFTCDDEKHTDLVPFIIHSWLANEAIKLTLNDEIYKTIDLVSNDINGIRELFEEYQWSAPYSYHEGDLL